MKKKRGLVHKFILLLLTAAVIVGADYVKNKEITVIDRLEENYDKLMKNIEKWEKDRINRKKEMERKATAEEEKENTSKDEPNVVVSGITYEISGGEAKIVKCENQSETIILPQKVNDALITVIGKNAFKGCSNLKYIDIQEGVHTLEEYSMADCHQLLYVVLPDSLKKVGDWSFKANEINFICHKGSFAQEYADMVKRPWFEGDHLQ